jgi:hypothetical protein
MVDGLVSRHQSHWSSARVAAFLKYQRIVGCPDGRHATISLARRAGAA